MNPSQARKLMKILKNLGVQEVRVVVQVLPEHAQELLNNLKLQGYHGFPEISVYSDSQLTIVEATDESS